jgi:hypothetical protein
MIDDVRDLRRADGYLYVRAEVVYGKNPGRQAEGNLSYLGDDPTPWVEVWTAYYVASNCLRRLTGTGKASEEEIDRVDRLRKRLERLWRDQHASGGKWGLLGGRA